MDTGTSHRVEFEKYHILPKDRSTERRYSGGVHTYKVTVNLEIKLNRI